MRLLGVILACVFLGGCGAASAATVDPADDVHCSILAFYFHGLANHQGVAGDQIEATRVLHEWYAARMRVVAADRWSDTAAYEKEVAPLLERIKSDPQAMADEMLACTDRAIASAGFDEFAFNRGS